MIEKQMNKQKLLKGEKGITLIALVTTIIILLILSGLGIYSLFGANGLITKVKLAREQYEISEYIDRIELSRENLKRFLNLVICLPSRNHNYFFLKLFFLFWEVKFFIFYTV